MSKKRNSDLTEDLKTPIEFLDQKHLVPRVTHKILRHQKQRELPEVVGEYEEEWHARQRFREAQRSDREQKAVSRFHFHPLLPQTVIDINKQTKPCSITQPS